MRPPMKPVDRLRRSATEPCYGLVSVLPTQRRGMRTDMSAAKRRRDKLNVKEATKVVGRLAQIKDCAMVLRPMWASRAHVPTEVPEVQCSSTRAAWLYRGGHRFHCCGAWSCGRCVVVPPHAGLGQHQQVGRRCGDHRQRAPLASPRRRAHLDQANPRSAEDKRSR